MRTTISLDPDVDKAVRKLMRERGMTLKQAVNEAIRSSLARPARGKAFRTITHDMGPASLPLDKAMRLAADLEDEEIVRKLALRK